MQNVITSLTKDEIDLICERCNFTKNEQVLLQLRIKEYTLEQCAELMNYSVRTICTINKKMNNKITKIIPVK